MPSIKHLADIDIVGKLSISNIPNNIGKLLTISNIDNKTVSYRTYAEVLLDIGASPTSHNHVISSLTGTLANSQLVGSYSGLTNLTGSGTVDFGRFLGNTTDTAALPSFSFTADGNTGMWSAGADQLGFSTGGTNRLTISTTALTSTSIIYAPGGNSTNWNTAHGWGNHSGLYSLVNHTHTTANVTLLTGYVLGTTNVAITTSDSLNTALGKLQFQISASTTGTVTSVGMSVPTGLTVSPSTITTSGTFALAFATGYSIPLITKQNNWDSAFLWGDHSGLYSLTAHNHVISDLTGTLANSQLVGSYSGLTNLTGSGTVDFGRFLGNTTDTAALPSFSFTADGNTGMWSAGADQLGFSTGGTNRLTISTTALTSTLNFGTPAGTALLPSHTFSADTNTGMWNLAADTIGFTTGGVTRLTLTGTTLTGTGVADFARFLGNTADSASLPSFSFTADPNTGMWSVGADQLGFTTGGVNRLTISTSVITSTLDMYVPSIKVGNVNISNSEDLNVDIGNVIIATTSSIIYTAVFFDYVVKRGSNVRAGTIYACHDGIGNIQYTETSTNDLGDTNDIKFNVDLFSNNIRLLANSNSNDWIIKTLVRAL